MRPTDQTRPARAGDGLGAAARRGALPISERRSVAAVGYPTPVLPVGLITMAVWFVWAWKDGGLQSTQWGSFGTGLVLLLLVGLAAVPVELRRLPPRRLAMLAALLAFVVWNFLSIAWADFEAEAWSGSAKTLVYAVAFLAFALWPYSPKAVVGLACLYVAGVTAIATLVLVETATSADPSAFFGSGRLVPPTGYVNANVALWMSAFWPAVYLGSARSLPAPVRGVLLACAGVLLDLAVLGQSRTWLLVFPVVAALAVLLARQRLRLLLALALVGAAGAAIAAPLLGVYEAYGTGAHFDEEVDRAARLIGASALVLAVIGALWAVVDARVVLGRRLHTAAGLAVASLCLAGAAAGVAKAASDVGGARSWAEARWHEFSNPSVERGTKERRLAGSFSGHRYEELTVAWHEFTAHPLAGIGSDNYAASYLLRRDNDRHEPRYPHSGVLRLLSQLGVIGTALFVVFGSIAVAEGLRRRRQASPLEAAAVSSLLMVFFYWWIHGAVDWFWELPALAAPAFGALALAGARRPDRERDAAPSRPRSSVRSRLAMAATVLAGALACLALLLPWLSTAYQDAGADVWRSSPSLAYERLGTAAALNPLAAEPLLLEGSIALRRGDSGRAHEALMKAVDREPRNWYAHFQLALLTGSLRRYQAAERHVERARALNPRDPVVASVRHLVRRRAEIDPEKVNAVYLERVEKLLDVGPSSRSTP